MSLTSSAKIPIEWPAIRFTDSSFLNNTSLTGIFCGNAAKVEVITERCLV